MSVERINEPEGDDDVEALGDAEVDGVETDAGAAPEGDGEGV
ncbi:hypothetical protein DSM25558_0208 [Agrobacterium sp. DSM 25558]|nr:hypothetical protein DSM25558_0208 [Agrobacterium sp. DSM 25558]